MDILRYSQAIRTHSSSILFFSSAVRTGLQANGRVHQKPAVTTTKCQMQELRIFGFSLNIGLVNFSIQHGFFSSIVISAETALMVPQSGINKAHLFSSLLFHLILNAVSRELCLLQRCRYETTWQRSPSYLSNRWLAWRQLLSLPHGDCLLLPLVSRRRVTAEGRRRRSAASWCHAAISQSARGC